MQKNSQFKEIYMKRMLLKRKRRKKRIIFRLVELSLILVVLLFSIYFSLGVFLKVEHIIIQGKSQYTDQEIIKAGNMKKNENIFSYNLGKIEKRIEEKLLYIDSVSAARKFPNKIILKIHKAIDSFAFENQKKYTILSECGKILIKNSLTICKDLDIILNVKFDLPFCGERVKDEKVCRIIKGFKTLRNAAKNAGIYNIKAYDLNDLENIEFFYGQKRNIKIKFGNLEQTKYKMQFLATILRNNINNKLSGEIDLTSLLTLRRAIWRSTECNINVTEVNEESKGKKAQDTKDEKETKKSND